ncbi:MAG: hypothetical protein ACRDNK_15895 [Solirubrobacteraceae bacterium]
MQRAASLDGHYRVLSYGSSANARFLTADRRSSFVLVFTPHVGFGSPDPTPAITAAVRRALAAGFSERTTGLDALQSSTGTGTGAGTGLLVQTLLGGLGALVVLAVAFASALAVLTLIMAIVAIPTTFLLLLGLTEITTINLVVECGAVTTAVPLAWPRRSVAAGPALDINVRKYRLTVSNGLPYSRIGCPWRLDSSSDL